LLTGVRVFAQPLGIASPSWTHCNWNLVWFGPEHYGVERAQIAAQLEKMPGPQLVIVRYRSEHNPLDEWVYNSADIDASKIVWAREMDAANNLELIRYYKGRTVWLVEPDAIPARISLYPTQDLYPAQESNR